MLHCRCEHCLRPVNIFTMEGCSKTGAYEHWSNLISRGYQLPKYLSYEADLFFQNGQNVYIPELPWKIRKIFSVFEIRAFEPFARISLIYDENTYDLQSSCIATKLLQCSFRQCSRPVNTFTVEEFSKTRGYWHWSNLISRGQKLSK